MKNTAQIWGRKLTAMEDNLIEIGEADAESGFLSGGMSAIAKKLYDSVFNKLIESEMSPVQMLLKAHCTSCSARLQLMDSVENFGWIELADVVKVSMSELQETLASLEDPSDFYLWREPLSLRSSVEYHVLLKMQLVAELLLEGQKPSDAQGFLEKASKDSPQNYDIAFSYGSFILQMALYNNDFEDPGMMKKAQKQLLKAAKLNVNKADPFALLGIWYEVQNDTKRAVGCYSKALLVDPSHPVAGRGVLRLKSARDVSTLCNNAMNQGIFQNGWAWKSFGDSKAYGEGDDEKAVLCYHQALRARDVGSPKQHRLNVFFSLPSESNDSEYKECGSTWASLGSCYRRLGKHSASVRAFQSASDIFPSDLSYFCSWAQGRFLSCFQIFI
jgi:tetratricopeptide (TPR) repeat protein